VYWLLLLSGDVELNPGPVYRFPCTVCSKPVKNNQRGVQCDRCDLWTHASCGGVGSREEYDQLSMDNTEWLCPSCTWCELPFAESGLPSDTQLSVMGLSNTTPTTGDTLLLECSSTPILCHLNVQSLMSKVDELRALLSGAKRPVVLGLSETWLDESVLDGEVSIPGYSQYRRDRTSKGGGVLVYVPESCHSRRRIDLESDKTEAVWVEVHLKKSTILLCTLYRPPNADALVLESLSNMIERASAESKEIVLMGDMNCNWKVPISTLMTYG